MLDTNLVLNLFNVHYINNIQNSSEEYIRYQIIGQVIIGIPGAELLEIRHQASHRKF